MYTGLGIAFGLGLLVIIYVFIRYRQKAVKNKPFIFFRRWQFFHSFMSRDIPMGWNNIVLTEFYGGHTHKPVDTLRGKRIG